MSEPVDAFESLFKWVVGGILTGSVASIGWLLSTVLKTKEKTIQLEGKVHELQSRINDFGKDRITIEDVRRVIADEFDRRDKAIVERRQEYDRIHRLELREAVREELEKVIPRIVREVKGTTDVLKRPNQGHSE